MADKKISEFPIFDGVQDAQTYYILASGEAGDPDADNYKMPFTHLVEDITANIDLYSGLSGVFDHLTSGASGVFTNLISGATGSFTKELLLAGRPIVVENPEGGIDLGSTEPPPAGTDAPPVNLLHGGEQKISMDDDIIVIGGVNNDPTDRVEIIDPTTIKETLTVADGKETILGGTTTIKGATTFNSTANFTDSTKITFGSATPAQTLQDIIDAGGKWSEGASAGDIHYSDGNVGIGTDDPDDKLHVNGDIVIGPSENSFPSSAYSYIRPKFAGAAIKMGTNSADWDRDLHLGHYDNNAVFTKHVSIISKDGNVGIGTTDPDLKLDIVAANNNQLRIDSSDTNDTTFILDYNGTGSTDRVRISNSAGDLKFSIANSYEAMRIDSDGNVGIGTSPTKPLEVAQANEYAGLRLNYLPDQYLNQHNADFYYDGIGALKIESWSASASTAGNIILGNNGGNVGIGTSPSYKLDVQSEGIGLRLKNSTPAAVNNSNETPSIVLQALGWDDEAGSKAYSARIRAFGTYSGAVGRGNTHPTISFDLETNEDDPVDNLTSKMLIGMDQVAVNANLHVKGAISFNALTDNPDQTEGKIYRRSDGLYFEDSKISTEGQSGKWVDGQTTGNIVYNSGNVGIGTLNPLVALQVNGDGYFAGNSIPNIAPAVGVYLGKSERGPDHHVSIISDNEQNGYIDFSTTSRDAIGRILYANSNSSGVGSGQGMYFYTDYENNIDNPDVFIGPDGKVGIGSNPSSKLQVNTFKDVTSVAVSCTSGQTTVSLTEDLTSVLSAGDTIRFGNSGAGDVSNKEFVVQTITASLLTLTDALNFDASLHISKSLPTLNVQSGSVAIGTATPSSSVLHVKSSLDGPIFDSGGAGNANHALLVRDSGNNTLMRVENNGNVGIGTKSPKTKLHIQGAQPVIRLQDTDTDLYSEISSDSGKGDLILIADGSSGSNAPIMSFRVGGGAVANEKMRIDSAGNVGIGTSTPADKLHIQGDSSTVYDDTSSGGQRTNSNLVIENKNTAANTFASLDFATNNNRVLNRIIGGHEDLSTQGFLAFVTENNSSTSEKMRIDSSGNVGIGTTSPDSKLDVSGGMTGKFIFRAINNTSTGHGAFIKGGGGQNQSRLHVEGSENSNNPFLITGDGKVGIGTASPSHDLTLGSPTSTGTTTERLKIYRGSDDAGQNLEMGFNSITVTRDANRLDDPQSTFSIKQKGSNDTRTAMHIDTSGFVGIGTESPSGLLTIGSSNPYNFPYMTFDNTEVESVDGTNIGAIFFKGKRPDGKVETGASIRAKGDGNASNDSNDLPGKIIFQTNPGGGPGLKDRMTIDKDGRILLQTVPTLNSNLDANTIFHEDGYLRIKGVNDNASLGGYGSDKKYKTEISPISEALLKVNSIKGVNFIWSDDAPSDLGGKKDVGVIAQDIQKVLPEAVEEKENGDLTVKYHRIIPLLIESIKELSEENKTLKSRLDKIEGTS